MTTPRRPPLFRPRLVSREDAATYCGVSPQFFDTNIRPHITPIEFGRRAGQASKRGVGRVLFDLREIDHWIDGLTGLPSRPIRDEEMLDAAFGGRG